MAGPIFLDVEDVIEMHQDTVATHGGEAGILSMDLLESAVAMPAMKSFGEFLHTDLFEMAAAYAFHLGKNHAFRDGNKRIGAIAAEVFLEINGFVLHADEPDHSGMVLDLVESRISKSDAAAFYRERCGSSDG